MTQKMFDLLIKKQEIIDDLEEALKPFAEIFESASKAFPNNRVDMGDVCRRAMSSFEFQRAWEAYTASQRFKKHTGED